MNKRGVIELQFNWIFILIVGFVIFAFIISIIITQQKSAQTKLSLEVTKQISTSIKAKQQSSDTYSELRIPQASIQITCEQSTGGGIAYFQIGDSQREPLPVEIIFTPRRLEGNMLKTWTLDFNAPFVVSRFLYITNDKHYFLIYSDDEETDLLGRKIYNDLPVNVSKKRATRDTIEQLKINAPTHTIICFYDSDSVKHCPGDGNPYIAIARGQSASELYDYGTLTFHTPTVGDTGSVYVGKASLFGALFAGNRQTYECQMNRAFEQFELKRKMLRYRIDLMRSSLNIDPVCKGLLAAAIIPLDEMAGPDLTQASVSSMYDQSQDIQSINADLELKSCPLIY